MIGAGALHGLAAAVLGAGNGDDHGALAIDAEVGSGGSFERVADSILIGVIDVGLVLIFLGICLCLVRLVKGPTLIDRGVAADTISLQVVGLVLLITVRLGSIVDFDAVLIVSILGFVSTVAFAQFIGRRGAVA